MIKFKYLCKMSLFFFALICTLPLVFIFVYMFVDRWHYPNILPNEFSFDTILKINSRAELRKAIVTSNIIGIVSSILAIVISIPTGKALAHYEFKGKKIISILVLLPLVLSPFTIVSVVHINLLKLNIHSTIIGVSIMHMIFILPYSIRIINDRFTAIGRVYELQAYSLGGSFLKTFFMVTLPIIMPSIILSFAMGFIISISQYLTTIIIGGGKIMTLTVLLIPYVQHGEYQIASVYSFILVGMTLFYYAVVLKLYNTFSNN